MRDRPSGFVEALPAFGTSQPGGVLCDSWVVGETWPVWWRLVVLVGEFGGTPG